MADQTNVVDAAPATAHAFSEPVLAALFGAMPDGAAFCRLDYQGSVVADLTVLYANQALHTITGLSDLVGQRFAALFPESTEAQPDVQNLLARVVEQGADNAYEQYSPKLDQWFSVSAYQPKAGHAMLVFRDVSSQHSVERALVRSEARLRAIIETAPIPLSMNDDQGNITYLNAAFRNTFGYTLSDIPRIADWWPKAYPDPQYRAWVVYAWSRRLAMAQRGGRTFEKLEVQVHCKDGSQRSVVADVVPLGTAFEGAHLVLLYDISEQKRAQQSLAAAEHYAEWILDSVGEGLCRVDETGVVRFINPMGAALLGYQPEHMVGQNAHRLFHHSHADGSHYPEEECKGRFGLLQGQPQSVDDEVFWRQDGSCFAVHYVSAPMRVDGHTRGTVLTFRNIDEERAIRQELLDNEVKIRKAQEIAGFGSYMTDLSTGLWESSAQLDAIFGVDASFVHDIPGWNLLIDPEFRAPALAHYEDVAAGRCEFRMDYRITRPCDGQQRWVAANGEIERDGKGQPLRLIGTIQDITERKQIETTLLHINETLESRVQERTRELVMALDAAEMAKTSRGQFLANMSHEIRTPMNTVMGMAHLALKTQPPTEMRHYLEKIQQSGAHLLNIINDILDFSKIDAGKLQLDMGIFALEPALQHIIQLSEGRAIEKGLRLQLDLESSVPPYVRADALRLSQILLNFLNNAIKFTQHGGVVLRVHSLEPGTQAPTEGSCLLRFEVVDTGIGVDPEQGQRLFKSFEQGDNSTTRKFGGTGLGLAISSQLATLMWGSVGVSGQPGVGSTFWLEVRLEVAAQPVAPPLAPVRDVDAAIQALCGRRVLVVDDNDFNLDVACGLLQDAAMEVAVARDGAQAVDAMLRSPFDCVLMDVQMPVMDGLQATRRIRSTPALAQLPVIAMTANAGQEDRSKCLAAGMNEVIVKPVEPDELFLTLARWMRDAVPRQEATAAPCATPLSLPISLPISTPLTAPMAALAQPAPATQRQAAALPDLSELPVWDEAALARIVGNNPSAHVRLLDKYRMTARETVAAMQVADEQAQWAQAADLAHKLKSSSRSVGAMRLGGLCEALERAGRSGDAPVCSALSAAVQQAFAEVLLYLN